MTALADHDITTRITHELSGLGPITKWEGSVLDSYAGPELVNSYVTISKERLLCGFGPDGRIHYFDRYGQEKEIPAPKSYTDDELFTSRVGSLLEATTECLDKQVHRENIKCSIWFGALWALAIGLFVTAFLTDEGGWTGGALGVFGLSVLFCPFGMDQDRALSDPVNLEGELPENEQVEFHHQLNHFAKNFDVTVSTSPQGFRETKMGGRTETYLVFKGIHAERGMGWFAVNGAATTLFHATYTRYDGELHGFSGLGLEPLRKFKAPVGV